MLGRAKRTARPHRGVVLLVVLSLLSLFVVIALTFMITAGQYRRAASAQARQKLFGDDPQIDLDRTMYILLRDTLNRTTLQGHSLLRDLYGEDGVVGTLQAIFPPNPTAVQAQMAGQFLRFGFRPAATQPFAASFRATDDYYNGCVLTMLNGPAAGESTRIVDYAFNRGVDGAWGTAADDDGDGDPDNAAEAGWPGSDDQIWIRVESFENDGPASLTPAVGNRFIVNGRPFSGAGAGYNVAAVPPGLSQTDGGPGPDRYVSLLPHYSGYPLPLPPALPIIPFFGGSDESYDAVDYQNMILAMVPPAAVRADQIIPSFHRPALIQYWYNWMVVNWFTPAGVAMPAQQQQLFLFPYGPDRIRNTPDEGGAPYSSMTLAQRDEIVALKRRISMRPLPEDHPDFSGSNLDATGNLNFPWLNWGFGSPPLDVPNAGRGTWDVDNDGDGVAESVWIDPGFSVKTAPDGRRYKILVAVLCKDLDGRLNLNAHGNLKQADATYADITSPTGLASVGGAFSFNPPSPAGTVLTLPRGSGYGPADINLAAVMANAADYLAVMVGRYGPDGQPGLTRLAAGQGVDDLFSYFKNTGMPYSYGDLTKRSAYGSPPDMFGRGALGLDYGGQPMTFYMGQAQETEDDPYELNLSLNSARDTGTWDSPYTAAELERLLRYHDLDAPALAERLVDLAGGTFANEVRRESVTTESRHIPVPNVTLPRERRGLGPLTGINHPSLLDLYRANLVGGGVTAEPAIRLELNKIVPFEIRKGQLFDINRPFGNGRDDTPAGQVGQGTADEPREEYLSPKELAWPAPQGVPMGAPPLVDGVPGIPNPFNTARFNHTNDDFVSEQFFAGTGTTVYASVRQQFARHLYCLMLVLTENNYLHPFDPADGDLAGSVANQREVTRRRLAQWAINVVDYRDADATMTPFEYDFNPWNGWDVDGDLRTLDGPGGTLHPDRRTVWGCEFPDLMITETKAFHDRRVKDTDFDRGDRRKRGSDINDDNDLDQFRIPQGSLFIELFCPRNFGDTTRHPNNNPVLPAELYNLVTGRLDVTRMSPLRPADSISYPVWRIAISEQTLGPGTPRANRPLARVGTHPDSTSFGGQIVPDGASPSGYSLEMSLPNVGSARLGISRVVWFTPLQPPVGTRFRDRIYNNNTPWDVSIEPGQYAVVGPRTVTYMGSIDDGDDMVTSAWDGNSPQSVTLQPFNRTLPNATGVIVRDVNGAVVSPAAGAQIKSVVGIVANTPRRDWQMANPVTQYIGLSVTEPLPHGGDYYQEPNPTNDGRIPPDAYDNPEPGMRVGTLPDEPFDAQLAPAPILPLRAYNMLATETYDDMRSAFLQRLADPSIPWNPEPGDPLHDSSIPVNPYITIDWASIDCTVFSGDEDTNRQVDGEDLDRDTAGATVDPVGPRPLNFGTRQRGVFPAAAAPRVAHNLWPPTAGFPDPTAATAVGTQYVRHSLFNTLGYLNSKEANPTLPFGRLVAGAQVPLGYQGFPDPSVSQTFPWLTWKNRPFNNPLELMLVPGSSASRLLFEFGTRTAPAGGPYDPSGGDIANFRAPYEHLLNFFHGTQRDFTGGGADDDGAHFVRLLDFVETPSPFVGTEKWYNPGSPNHFADTNQAAGDFLRPPYNRMSRFRDPGRINLNTIPITHWLKGPDNMWGTLNDDDGDGNADNIEEAGWPGSDDVTDSYIWRGLMRPYFGMNSQAFWNLFRVSRQGFPDLGSNIQANPTAPSRYANPFRSATSGDMMPPIAVDEDLDGTTDMPLQRDDVQATLLRSNPNDASAPLFASTAGTPYNHTGRNAFFCYQGLTRLGNLMSTHSNVYAVWITIGYFEVEPNLQFSPPPPYTAPPPYPVLDAGHLDGYRLGQELGTDTGEVKRHRAFYIIDRSISVAFEPGKNHNVDRAILLRRMIE